MGVSSARLLRLALLERNTLTGQSCRFYSKTVSCTLPLDGNDDDATFVNPSSAGSFKSKKGPIKLASILQHASQQSQALLNGINGKPSSSTQNHPAHHFVAGGTPCDPAPQPFHLADTGEDSLYTLVLLRHGESEWNALNRKFLFGEISVSHS